MPRDDTRENALVYLDESRHGGIGHLSHITPHGRSDDAFDRPLPWRALLRYSDRRVCDPLDALFLDLRASGSLRSGNPGLRVCIGDHSGIFAQTDLRIPRHGGRNDLHCVYRYECMGPPHVHDRYDFLHQQLFRSYDDGYRGPHRHKDFQLARHDVGRKDPVQDGDAVLHRIPVPVPDCRAHRCDDVRRAVRLATRQFLFRCRPLSLCDRGWDFVLPFWRVLLLVSENDWNEAERNAGQASLLALRDRFSPDVLLNARSWVAWHAAAYLHVRTRAWLGNMESDRNDWGLHSGHRHTRIYSEPCSFLL